LALSNFHFASLSPRFILHRLNTVSGISWKAENGGRKFGAGRVARWKTCLAASGDGVGERERRMKHERYFAWIFTRLVDIKHAAVP